MYFVLPGLIFVLIDTKPVYGVYGNEQSVRTLHNIARSGKPVPSPENENPALALFSPVTGNLWPLRTKKNVSRRSPAQLGAAISCFECAISDACEYSDKNAITVNCASGICYKFYAAGAVQRGCYELGHAVDGCTEFKTYDGRYDICYCTSNRCNESSRLSVSITSMLIVFFLCCLQICKRLY